MFIQCGFFQSVKPTRMFRLAKPGRSRSNLNLVLTGLKPRLLLVRFFVVLFFLAANLGTRLLICGLGCQQVVGAHDVALMQPPFSYVRRAAAARFPFLIRQGSLHLGRNV